MTDAEWRECADPKPMLELLRGTASDRKLRLFACGFCRQIWDRFVESDSRVAVEVAGKYADGYATIKQLTRASKAAEDAILEALRRAGEACGPDEEDDTELSERHYAEQEAVMHAGWAEGCAHPDNGWAAAWLVCQEEEDAWISEEDQRMQVALLRDVIGNPFRTAKSNRVWSTWNESLVSRLAQGIYTDRAFDRLPILADALEDAGCDNTDILAHCRQPGEHVRGCWVVDLLLGKS